MFFSIPRFGQNLYITKLHVLSILFSMLFLKTFMAQLIRLDSFLQTYFSIFCEKLRIYLENCFVIFFFCNCAMHGAVETYNSIFEKLIFDVFFNTKVLAEFVFYLILFEEYCEFGRKEKLSFGEMLLVNFFWWKSFFFFFLTGRSLCLIEGLVKFGEKTEVYFF